MRRRWHHRRADIVSCHRNSDRGNNRFGDDCRSDRRSGHIRLCYRVGVSDPLLLRTEIGSKKLSTVYYSPSSIELNSGRLYVADSTNFAVYRMTADGKTEKTGLFDEKVEKVLCANGMVYALVGERNGRLVVMDSDLKVKKTILVGHTPSDLYIKGAKAYVANRFSNTVSVVDLDTGKVTSAIEVSREPSYLAAAGNSLYVGCRAAGRKEYR